MVRGIVVSICSGILFGILDALINSNPLAQRLYEAYTPIAKTSVNIFAGVAIDLVYGFIMAAIFLVLYKSLPGKTGLMKGISFAILVWFFRVVMSVVSSWMMFDLPAVTLLYTIVAGLVEMLILGVLYGLTLKSGALRQEA